MAEGEGQRAGLSDPACPEPRRGRGAGPSSLRVVSLCVISTVFLWAVGSHAACTNSHLDMRVKGGSPSVEYVCPSHLTSGFPAVALGDSRPAFPAL